MEETQRLMDSRKEEVDKLNGKLESAQISLSNQEAKKCRYDTARTELISLEKKVLTADTERRAMVDYEFVREDCWDPSNITYIVNQLERASNAISNHRLSGTGRNEPWHIGADTDRIKACIKEHREDFGEVLFVYDHVTLAAGHPNVRDVIRSYLQKLVNVFLVGSDYQASKLERLVAETTSTEIKVSTFTKLRPRDAVLRSNKGIVLVLDCLIFSDIRVKEYLVRENDLDNTCATAVRSSL